MLPVGLLVLLFACSYTYGQLPKKIVLGRGRVISRDRINTPIAKQCISASNSVGTIPDHCLDVYSSAALIDVFIGTPPGIYKFIFDTGSSAIGVATSTCKVEHTGKPCDAPHAYDYNASTTYTEIQCAKGCTCSSSKHCVFVTNYEDQTGGSGYLMQDDFQLAGLPAKQVEFGGIITAKATAPGYNTMFSNRVDGVMGIAYRSLNCHPGTGTYCPLTIMDQLLNQNNLRDVFSLWVGNTRNNGTLTLGGTSKAEYNNSVAVIYTPITTGLYYSVTLRSAGVYGPPNLVITPAQGNTTKITVDTSVKWLVRNDADSFGSSEPIVDTGTTNLILPKPVFDAWKKAVVERVDLVKKEYTGSNLEDLEKMFDASSNESLWVGNHRFCNFPTDFINKLPTLYLYLAATSANESDVPLQIPAAVCFQYDTTQNPCLQLGLTPTMDGEGSTIIGDTVLQKYYVEFNREQRKIGFARVNDAPDTPLTLWWDAPKPPPNTAVVPDHGFPLWLVLSVGASTITWVLLVICVCFTYERRSHLLKEKEYMVVGDNMYDHPMLADHEAL